MDNLAFQPDLESGYLHHQTSLSEGVPPHLSSSSPYVIFPDNTGRRNARPASCSASFSVPRKSNASKYRRFSGSLSLKRPRVRTETCKAIALNNEPLYCSIPDCNNLKSSQTTPVPSLVNQFPNKVAKNTNLAKDSNLQPPADTVPTVSAGVPLYLYPRPCADNKRNLRRSSKMEVGGHGARLKRRGGGLRGWKLQFIPSDHSQRKSLLLCCVLGLACALILLATGLVVYVTTVMGSLTAKLESKWHSIDPGVNVVAGEFRIVNEEFEPALLNTSSSDYRQLAQQIAQLLDLVFSRSTLAGTYNRSRVTNLGRPSPSAAAGVHVKCQVLLTSVPPHGEAANLVGLEFLRGLQHRRGQMWLGDFVVDVQSIGFVALLDDSGPASSATPSATLQPGWSPWSEWSECGPSGRTQSRSRLCRLDQGRGTVLSSIEPCLLLDAGGGDLQVRDCNGSVEVVMAATMFKNGEGTRGALNTPKEAVTEVDSAVATTSIIPVMDLSVSLRHCDECVDGEVCVAVGGEQVPTCRQPLDSADPTGCGGLCTINTEVCHKLDVDAFRCVDDSFCLPTEWRCANQLCIPQVKRCDGHMNCYDRTDEYDCDCDLASHFQCGNSTSCLPQRKRCDGVIDCWDGTDELNCTTACPSAAQFTCTSGQCVPRARFCDGFSDCADHSDEPFGCGGSCKNHEWKCSNGRCIKKQMVCDGSDSCGDQSDEQNCPLRRQERNFEERLYVR